VSTGIDEDTAVRDTAGNLPALGRLIRSAEHRPLSLIFQIEQHSASICELPYD
jgi:hypothetical protein